MMEADIRHAVARAFDTALMWIPTDVQVTIGDDDVTVSARLYTRSPDVDLTIDCSIDPMPPGKGKGYWRSGGFDIFKGDTTYISCDAMELAGHATNDFVFEVQAAMTLYINRASHHAHQLATK